MADCFYTLSGYVKKQRAAGTKSNPSRLKYEPGPIARLFFSASASPGRWVEWTSPLFLLGTWSSESRSPPSYPVVVDFSPIDEKYSPTATFLRLWAAQAEPHAQRVVKTTIEQHLLGSEK